MSEGNGNPSGGPPKEPRPSGALSIDPLIGRVLLDRYEILRKIGAGGMGSVYVAKQTAVGREVAVKVLRGELMSNESIRERFRREAEIIAKLRHPNTIQLYDYGEVDGMAVMVMELLVGQGLAERLRQTGPLPIKEAVRLCQEMAGSLAEAHALGLVHRDLKPANIFVVEVAGKTHAKVLDFGIAKILDEESTRITSTGQVFGTPRYMSPEQGLATGEVDHRSDIYSLGLILYECLVGQPPFVANTSLQYLNAHATQPPPKLGAAMPDCPPGLEQLVDACLLKERSERIQTAHAVEEALRRILVQLESGAAVPAVPDLVPPRLRPVETTSPPTQPADAPKPGGSLAPLLAGAAAVLAGLGLFAWLFFFRGPTPVAEAMDAGLDRAEAPDLGMLDLGVAVALVPDAGEADAGEADAGASAEDAAVAAAPDAGAPPKKGPRGSRAGDRAITGPRAMTVDLGGDEGDGPVELAAKCSDNQVPSGPAKLTIAGCRKGCAVLVDGLCAGKTPLDGLAMPEGNKTVTVVCGKRMVIESFAKLRAEQTVSLNCQ